MRVISCLSLSRQTGIAEDILFRCLPGDDVPAVFLQLCLKNCGIIAAESFAVGNIPHISVRFAEILRDYRPGKAIDSCMNTKTRRI